MALHHAGPFIKNLFLPKKESIMNQKTISLALTIALYSGLLVAASRPEDQLNQLHRDLTALATAATTSTAATPTTAVTAPTTIPGTPPSSTTSPRNWFKLLGGC